MRNEDDILRYIDDASRLGLRVGLEYDLGVAPPLRAGTREALHYVIGAVHQIPLDGGWIRYDDAGVFLKGRGGRAFAGASRFADEGRRARIREAILRAVSQGIERDRIDILGHPTFSPLAALGDLEAAYPEEWQLRLISLCTAGDVAIEVNEAYRVPHREFLVRAHALGARFAVGSDTHFELGPLDRTEAMIAAAALPHERFLAGARVRA